MITAETKYHKKGLGGLVPKEYEVYNSIINECKSIVRVTLATAVLDNGVNLKDSALKHLAVLEMNPTTFLQMIGRKRLESPEEQINLYLQSKDTGEIKAYFERSILQYVRFLVELQTVNVEADTVEWKNDERVFSALRRFQLNIRLMGVSDNLSAIMCVKNFLHQESSKMILRGGRIYVAFSTRTLSQVYD